MLHKKSQYWEKQELPNGISKAVLLRSKASPWQYYVQETVDTDAVLRKRDTAYSLIGPNKVVSSVNGETKNIKKFLRAIKREYGTIIEHKDVGPIFEAIKDFRSAQPYNQKVTARRGRNG